MHKTRWRPRFRLATALVATAALALSACSSDDDNDNDNDDSSNPDQLVAVDLPDTPVGQQLQWLLDEIDSLPVSEEDAAENFSPEFLDEVGVDDLNPQLEYLSGVVITGILEDTPESLLVEGDIEGEGINIAVELDSDERIDTLLFLPPDDHSLPAQPTSWEELDDRLDAIAPNGAFLAAQLTADDQCESVHAQASSDPIAVGSVFKLFVLQAIAEAADSGEISWDDSVEITDELKSLPTGELQDRPDGDEVSVAEAAQLMVSISDNTATDMLIDLVGRTAVEEQIIDLAADPQPSLPLVDTRQLFDLKLNDYPDELKNYLALSDSDKAEYLDSFTGLGTPSEEDLESWSSQPRSVEELEWFFSPEDICTLYGALDQWDDEEVEQAMSVHDGGLELTSTDWNNVWFKGGSEPGVYALSHLGKHDSGDRYVVTIMANNPEEAFDETEVELEMVSLVSGALQLLANELSASAPTLIFAAAFVIVVLVVVLILIVVIVLVIGRWRKRGSSVGGHRAELIGSGRRSRLRWTFGFLLFRRWFTAVGRGGIRCLRRSRFSFIGRGGFRFAGRGATVVVLISDLGIPLSPLVSDSGVLARVVFVRGEYTDSASQEHPRHHDDGRDSDRQTYQGPKTCRGAQIIGERSDGTGDFPSGGAQK